MTLESTPIAMVGRPAPSFNLGSTKDLDTLEQNVRLADYEGRWLVMVFYPLDFTFVCPTELRSFSDRYDEFVKEGADVLGISVDSPFVHRAWMAAGKQHGGLGELRYPLASDMSHEAGKRYGVYREDLGHTLRGTFIIDPSGVLRHSSINDLDVGRSAEEVLRTLRALRTGGLCPAGWQPGQATLKG